MAFLLLLPATVAFADVEWHGFLEAGYGLRVAENPRFADDDDYTLQEVRAQLRLSSYGDRGEVFLRADLLHDQVAGKDTDLNIREGFLRFTTVGDHLDVKAGRQALTWGTGDLLFINDLFPKDWVSFFIGREDQYLKAPVDAIRLGIYGLPLNVDIVLSPHFTPDNLPSGERLSFFMPEDVVGTVEPPDTFENGELAVRLSRYVGSVDLALYGYSGFFKTPRGLAPSALDHGTTLLSYYPELRVYGASARGSGLGGVIWMEGGYYDSCEDRDGDDPYLANSSFRFLGGFERQVYTDFNLGFQYYGDWMMDHDEYVSALPSESWEQDELRQILTLRAEKMLHYQTVRLSLFTFYSPTDEDVYVKAMAGYRFSDEIELALGLNVFEGENEATQFGQFDDNDNVYARFRYNF
jgi:hypothetical protein